MVIGAVSYGADSARQLMGRTVCFRLDDGPACYDWELATRSYDPVYFPCNVSATGAVTLEGVCSDGDAPPPHLTTNHTSSPEAKALVGATAGSCSRTADCPVGTYCDSSSSCYPCSYVDCSSTGCDAKDDPTCCGAAVRHNCPYDEYPPLDSDAVNILQPPPGPSRGAISVQRASPSARAVSAAVCLSLCPLISVRTAPPTTPPYQPSPPRCRPPAWRSCCLHPPN